MLYSGVSERNKKILYYYKAGTTEARVQYPTLMSKRHAGSLSEAVEVETVEQEESTNKDKEENVKGCSLKRHLRKWWRKRFS